MPDTGRAGERTNKASVRADNGVIATPLKSPCDQRERGHKRAWRKPCERSECASKASGVRMILRIGVKVLFLFSYVLLLIWLAVCTRRYNIKLIEFI